MNSKKIESVFTYEIDKMAKVDKTTNYLFSLHDVQSAIWRICAHEASRSMDKRASAEIYACVVRFSLENNSRGDQNPFSNLHAENDTKQFETDCAMLENRFKLRKGLANRLLVAIKQVNITPVDLIGKEVKTSTQKARGTVQYRADCAGRFFKVQFPEKWANAVAISAEIANDGQELSSELLMFYTAGVWYTYTKVFSSVAEGLQWAVPADKMQQLIDTYKITVEMFASTINRNFAIDEYGAVFNIDKFFGALGNSLLIEDEFFVGKSIEANPPFTEFMISALINKALRVLELGPGTTFVLVLPNWDDMEAMKRLRATKYLKLTAAIGEFRSHQQQKNIRFDKCSLFVLQS